MFINEEAKELNEENMLKECARAVTIVSTGTKVGIKIAKTAAPSAIVSMSKQIGTVLKGSICF